MAATTAAVGVIAAALTLTVALGTVAAASVHGQRLAGAADAAALAAADAASGAVAGVPCERAAVVAVSAGAEVTACELEGLIATVTVSAPFGVFPAAVQARAGPPTRGAP
ncbi:helicase [Microbacterium sp. P04]|uniref:helicase n=1 Tax=Microbacterium sp. P04 TaxID=3366947 RepID=UPI003745D092